MAEAAGYRVVFGSPAIEHRFIAYLVRLDRPEQKRVKDRVDALAFTPRPPGKPFTVLRPPVQIGSLVAQYRLRIGNHRVLYDVADAAREVVILAIRRRAEDTYR